MLVIKKISFSKIAGNLAGGVLKIHFLQNTYYYLSITYKFLKKWAFVTFVAFLKEIRK
jgi:hypothetical protein